MKHEWSVINLTRNRQSLLHLAELLSFSLLTNLAHGFAPDALKNV